MKVERNFCRLDGSRQPEQTRLSLNNDPNQGSKAKVGTDFVKHGKLSHDSLTDMKIMKSWLKYRHKWTFLPPEYQSSVCRCQRPQQPDRVYVHVY